MKYLVLALLVACTASEPKPTKASPQKSEYTVAPCACMKIFRPVCGSDAQTYGNSCEAECRKVTWTEGACK